MVLYRLRVAFPQDAARVVSPAVKHNLHRSATGIYVEPWLSQSQLQARLNLQPVIRQLSQRGVRWRWSHSRPTRLEHLHHDPATGCRRWQAVYPSPPEV